MVCPLVRHRNRWNVMRPHVRALSICLDDVEGVGTFVETAVAVTAADAEADASTVAEEWRIALGVSSDRLVVDDGTAP